MDHISLQKNTFLHSLLLFASKYCPEEGNMAHIFLERGHFEAITLHKSIDNKDHPECPAQEAPSRGVGREYSRNSLRKETKTSYTPLDLCTVSRALTY